MISRGRLPIVILLIVSLLLMASLQHLGEARREVLIRRPGSVSSLSSLNSYTLVLLLGGLRGPLVMRLWTDIESQKSHRDLEDVDTEIDLVRLLMEEFDSVHLFQIWNKAYNISALMASLANKYTSILEGIQYGLKVEAVRPNDLNIVYTVGDVFASKLGTAAERDYYVDRVERESFPPIKITLPATLRAKLDAAIHLSALDDANIVITNDPPPPAGKAQTISLVADKLSADRLRLELGDQSIIYAPQPLRKTNPDEPPTRLPPMLDLHGNLLPAFSDPDPTIHCTPGIECNDGAELQYLRQFQPFPFGLSPLGIGWNYYKRAQVIQDVTRQTHLQVAANKIDDRPAVGLKIWSEGEFDQASRLEMVAYGQVVPELTLQRGEIIDFTARLTPDTALVAPALVPEAVYRYTLLDRLLTAAEYEYGRHLQHYALRDLYMDRWHLAEMRGKRTLALADAAFIQAAWLRSANAPDQQRRQSLANAKKLYIDARRIWQLNLLQFAADAKTRHDLGYAESDISQLPPAQLDQLFEKYHSTFPPVQRDMNDNRNEYRHYFDRADQRLKSLSSVVQ